MHKTSPRRLDVYSEFCPASSATIIGAGLVTVTMGSMAPGLVIVLAGIAVGVVAPFARSWSAEKVVTRKH